MTSQFQPGQKVHYIPFPGCSSDKYENGIVKSVSDHEHVFVVFHCGGEWDRYTEYTAARTNVNQLRAGWYYGG